MLELGPLPFYNPDYVFPLPFFDVLFLQVRQPVFAIATKTSTDFSNVLFRYLGIYPFTEIK